MQELVLRIVIPSFNSTVSPTLHETLKLKLVLDVILSVFDEPVSEVASRSGVPGVEALVSTVTDKIELTAL